MRKWTIVKYRSSVGHPQPFHKNCVEHIISPTDPMLFLMKYFTFHQFSSLHYIFIKIQHNNYLLCEVLKIIACVLPKELFFFFCWCYFASWGSVLNPSNSLVMDGFSCKDVEDWNTNDSLSLPFPFFPFPCMDWHRMVLITLMWVRCLVFDLPLFFSSGH